MMESPGKRSGSIRNGANIGGRRLHRSASAASRSSTSSEILVAPGPPTTSEQPPMYESPMALSPKVVPAEIEVEVDIRNGRVLVVKAKSDVARAFLASLKDSEERNINAAFDESVRIKEELYDDDGHGPNRRGTYSKAYTLLHPEIEWVHRGQGRYLPASQQSRKSMSNRSDSNSRTKVTDGGAFLKSGVPSETKTRSPSVPQRRRSLDDRKTSIFATPKQRISLRRQISEAQTVSSADQRSVRLSRRNQPLPSTELERRSSRFTTQQSYHEESDNDDMAEDKEPTYDKEYVDNHPNEKFYHTGNGWYKKGERPRERRMAKQRQNEGHATMRRRDGTWQFDHGKTIHVSQLSLYPGVEFHHCGNGWYKPGPDQTGHRASLIAGDEETLQGDGDDEGEEDDNIVDMTVSKEYAEAHPDVEWVHRGNGRYKRKSVVSGSGTQASDSTSPAAERDQTIYDKAYVEAHPAEEFHHRGNARYMRGPPPDHWQSSRRKRMAAAVASVEPQDDPRLYSRSYVKQHRSEEFHHRGQGRYARGPKPMSVSVMDESEDEDDEDPEGLVDTNFVNTHPDETFHHRGQGRWARGLPPPGSSNKVAIRGPATKDRSSDAANLLEDEDEDNKPPAITALVVKADGPDKWPGLAWHYRGGGKWGRLTKQMFLDMQRGGSRKTKGKGRARNLDGPEAQLEREFAASEAAQRRYEEEEGDEDGGDIDADGLTAQERPKVKRRRTNKRGSFQTQEEGLNSKQSSNSQSQAPTPKPRMLEPEEDMLTEEDLPGLYEDDDWSPDPDEIDTYGPYAPDNLFRPINSPDKFVKALTKHDPAVRSMTNLTQLAENTQRALDAMQQEFTFLERITAPHARIPRKPAKGGRIPVDQQIFEDRKEADLYDYSFDQRRIGYQDPDAQKIQRDADGRELRNRRQRNTQNNNGTLPGWNFGEDEPLGPRRAVKPVNRFDGIVDQPRRPRGRNSTNATGRNSKAPSMTPDRVTTPLGGPAPNLYEPATSGRWRNHMPKRIRELRGDSVPLSTTGAQGQRETTPGGSKKGRPPGSKNLHKRRDAGIKKGPRKPKGAANETPEGSDGEDEI